MGVASWIPKDREKRRSLKLVQLSLFPPTGGRAKRRVEGEKAERPGDDEEEKKKRGRRRRRSAGRDAEGWPRGPRKATFPSFTKIVSDAFDSYRLCQCRSFGFYRFPSFVAFPARGTATMFQSGVPKCLFGELLKKCCLLEKSRKNLANIWPKFSKNSAKFGKICKNLQKKQQNFQQFLTKILRLENGAKECIV